MGGLPEYVNGVARRQKEVFMPLAHRPDHTQVDFGEANGYIGGKKIRFHYFCLDMPHSDACFVKSYPTEDTEAFLDGHLAAFAFLGGVPQSILYGNTRITVAKILGDGQRQRTQAFAELQNYYRFDDKFGPPAKGNDKGEVEGLVDYSRRHFMVPLPVTPYDHSHKQSRRVSSRALVRDRTNDYSVPTQYGHQAVLVKGTVDWVDIYLVAKPERIAHHRRSYAKADLVMNPLHYLALLEKKPRALECQSSPKLSTFHF
jgi:transposase